MSSFQQAFTFMMCLIIGAMLIGSSAFLDKGRAWVKPLMIVIGAIVFSLGFALIFIN